MEKKLFNSFPATHWQEATPVGNGRLGASIYGAAYDERILINHEALYNWVCNSALPDVSEHLSKVRALMDEKRYKEANSYYENLIKETGFKSNKGKFFPAFDLHLLFDNEGAPQDYKRELDMEKGICTVSYTQNGNRIERRTIASKTDGCVVVSITAEKPISIRATLERHDMADYVDSWYADEFNTFAKGEYIYSESKTAGGLHFSGIVKVLSCNGKINSGISDKSLKIDMTGSTALQNYIGLEDITSAVLILDVCEMVTPFEEMKEQIDKVDNDIAGLYTRHANAFSKIFNRVKLNIAGQEEYLSNEALLLSSYGGVVDTRLIERMADFGRYLLISSSTDCQYPANLQGLWNGAYSPAWACTFFNNENIQMAYWQAFQGDIAECALPLFNLYDRFKDDYRLNAKNLYGARGLLLPLFMDNSNGLKENLQPHVLYWTGSSAWISAIYYDYYLYTGDKSFLLERAYPFMKESALFYEDFYVEDERGLLKSYPANSPENRPDGDFEGAKELSVSINPTMDFALFKELLTNLISASKVLDIDSEDRARWENLLKKIPQYEINEDGAIKEWLHPDFKDNYHHRHQSHIYPLFPGFEINEDDTPKLYEATRVAVEKRLCIGLKAQTGWSLAHMSNIYARLSDGKRAKECLDLLCRFCTGNNLYTHHNDWRNMGVTLKFLHAGHPPFQIDANMGFTSAVYEMLLFSDGKKIKLLPALPKEWKKGSIEGIKARGGYTVSIYWSETEVKAKITATKAGTLMVKAPNGARATEKYTTLTLDAGTTAELTYAL
ncbi:MAG: glycoside hydrolase family 95 protein [Clostridia bacterium]|nr:glycoside hydrolase family 95 protein [Clostridia bacterium]